MDRFKRLYLSGKVYKSTLPIPIPATQKTLIVSIVPESGFIEKLLTSKMLKTVRVKLFAATPRIKIPTFSTVQPNWAFEEGKVLKKKRIISRTKNDLVVGSESTVFDLGPYISMLMEKRFGKVAIDKFVNEEVPSIFSCLPDMSGFDNILFIGIPDIESPTKLLGGNSSVNSFMDAFLRHYCNKTGVIEKAIPLDKFALVLTDPKVDFVVRFDPNDPARLNTQSKAQSALTGVSKLFAGKVETLTPEERAETEIAKDNSVASAISTVEPNVKKAASEAIVKANVADDDTAAKIIQTAQEIDLEKSDTKAKATDLPPEASPAGDIMDSPELLELLQSVNTPETFADAKKTRLKAQAEKRSDAATIRLYGEKEISLNTIDISLGDQPVVATKLKQKFLNPNMSKNTSIAATMEYIKNGEMMRDFTRVIKSLSEDKEAPLFITNIEIEDASDALSFKDNIRLTFRDEQDKSHTVNLEMPKITDDGYLMLNGAKWSITKQIIAFTIIKTKPNQVLVTTAYNKATIERFGQNVSPVSNSVRSLFKSVLDLETSNPKIRIVLGNLERENDLYEMDPLFKDICSVYSKVEIGNVTFNFARAEMDAIITDECSPKQRTVIDQLQSHNAQPCGIIRDEKGKLGSIALLMPNAEVTLVNDKGDSIKYNGAINDFVLDLVNKYKLPDNPDYTLVGASGKKFNFSRIKLLKRQLPLVLVVGFAEGLVQVLQRYKSKFAIISPEKFRSLKAEDKRNKDWIKFKDGYIIFDTNHIRDVLLLNGMKQLPTEEYSLVDYEAKGKGWVDYIGDLTGSVGYVKGLKNFQLSLLDPISKGILRDMGIEDDFVGVMLYVNTLLENDQFKEASDMSNYRIRGYEMLNGILYKLLHKEMERVRATKDSALPQKFSISPKALITEIVTTSNVEELQALNPLVESEMRNKVTWVGFGGLGDGEMVTKQMRAFHPSMKGIFGYFSPDSNKIGVNRTLSDNTAIRTVRGYLGQHDDSAAVDATKILAVNELLNPFASVHSDPPRIGMLSKQSSHTLPIAKNTPLIVGSGAEKAIAETTGNTFVFKAQQPGKIIAIDETHEFISLQYKDGSKAVIDTSIRNVKNSGGGKLKATIAF